MGGSPLVKPTVEEGMKRILAKPKVRKEPVTADMLKAMVEAAGPDPPMSEVRLLAVVWWLLQVSCVVMSWSSSNVATLPSIQRAR